MLQAIEDTLYIPFEHKTAITRCSRKRQLQPCLHICWRAGNAIHCHLTRTHTSLFLHPSISETSRNQIYFSSQIHKGQRYGSSLSASHPHPPTFSPIPAVTLLCIYAAMYGLYPPVHLHLFEVSISAQNACRNRRPFACVEGGELLRGEGVSKREDECSDRNVSNFGQETPRPSTVRLQRPMRNVQL